MTTSNSSKGTIRIVDSDGVYVTETEQVSGEVTIDITDGFATTGTTLTDGDGSDIGLLDSVGPALPSDRSPSSSVISALTDERWSAWIAVLPAVTTLLGIGLTAVFGTTIWSVTDSQLPGTIVRITHVFWFGMGVVGTLWLWNDAEKLAADRRTWTPSPLAYTLAGSLVFALCGIGYYLPRGYAPDQLIVGFFGMALVGLPVSSTIAGPVYLYNRYRSLGVLAGAEEE